MVQKTKIRILMVCTVPTEKSGIPNVIFNLLGSLNGENLKFGYVAINTPPAYYEDRLRNLNVDLYIIHRKISSPLRYIRELTKVAKKYDIIHIHGNSATMLLEMIAAKLAGVKLRIAHSHNTMCTMKCIDKICRPLFYTMCNARLSCGKLAGKWLFGNRDYTIINNGIDVRRYSYDSYERMRMRKNLSIEKCKVIGHIGNFVEQKNHKFIIQTFVMVTLKDPTARLLLLGDGVLKSSIKDLVNDYDIGDKVIFAGSVDNVASYMQTMDIVILPSIYEGLPLCMIEAQANGLSIIASDVISADADLTGNVIFLPLAYGPKHWADKISEMLPICSMRDARTSDSAISKIRNAGYDIHETAKRLTQFYKKKLEQN